MTDGKHVSAPATVTFTVSKPNNTVPSITLQSGGTANTAGTAATVKVKVGDLETPAANLKMLGDHLERLRGADQCGHLRRHR